MLLVAGVDAPGVRRLIEGLAFSSGFFFVILSESVLFTEANVVLPATVLEEHRGGMKVARFWVLALIGNFLGALLIAAAISAAQMYDTETIELLGEVVEHKMAYREIGGLGAWLAVVLSGVLANWLVGMAAFFAMMARTILGKYIPVALAVTAFVAANLQQSPANMGYFSLLMSHTEGPGWVAAFAWNILPAGVGNLIGGLLLVALPFWFVFDRPAARASARE